MTQRLIIAWVGLCLTERKPTVLYNALSGSIKSRAMKATASFGRTGHHSTRAIFGAAALSRVTQEAKYGYI